MIRVEGKTVTFTFVNDFYVTIELDGRGGRGPEQRYVKAEVYSPHGGVRDAGYYSADNLAALLKRTSEIEEF